MEPYAKELGAEVLVSDDNGSYSVAAAELGLSHQLCIAHVRKYLKRRSKSILEQAEGEWGDQDERYDKLEEDLKRVRGLLEELPEGGESEIGRLHREYLWAGPPTRNGDGGRKDRKEGEKEEKRKKENASAGYRMRMLTLELWQKWPKMLLHLRRPELGLDGHQQRFGTLHRQEQGALQDDAWLQERGGDEQRGGPDAVAVQRRGRAQSGRGDGGVSPAGEPGETDSSNSPTACGTVTTRSPILTLLRFSDMGIVTE